MPCVDPGFWQPFPATSENSLPSVNSAGMAIWSTPRVDLGPSEDSDLPQRVKARAQTLRMRILQDNQELAQLEKMLADLEAK